MPLKVPVCEKKNMLEKITIELERTQKSIKTMNFGIKQLNHILTLGKSSIDHHGLGYKEIYTSSADIVLVKVSPLVVKFLDELKSKDVAHSSPTWGTYNKFVPIYHFCNVRGHIRLNFVKFMNYMKKAITSNFSTYWKSLDMDLI